MAELQQHVVGGKISEAQSSNKLQFEKQSGPIPPYHNSFPEYTCLSSSTKSFVAGEGGGRGEGVEEEERLIFSFEVESIGRTKEMSTRA